MTNQRKRPSPTGPAQDDHEGVQAAAGVIGATGAHRSNGGGWIGGDIRASAAHEQADDRSTLAFGRAAGGAMVGDGQDLTQGPAGERGIGSGWSTGSAATAGALANPGDESLMLSSSNSIQCSGPASASASASALSLSSSSSSPSLGSSGMSLADSDQDTVVMGSPEQNFRGFFNLAMLLLGVSNLRLIVENFEKYGWLLNIPLSGVRLVDLKFMVLAVGCLGVRRALTPCRTCACKQLGAI
nr:hypothetical protein HK105_004951 [Polyrhizophydium stewartii]